MLKIWKFKVNNHKVIDFPKDQFNNYLLNLKNGFYEFVLRRQSKQRSLPQNSYYWGVIVKLLSEHTGYMPEEMHGVLKWKFVRTKGFESSTQLNTIEFTELIEEIRDWAQVDLDINIPAPNEIELN